MPVSLWTCLIVGLVVAPEPDFNGKSQSHWLRALNHPMVSERVAAISALGNLLSRGHGGGPVLAALRRALDDPDPRVRLAAVETLGDHGEDRGASSINASAPTGTLALLVKRLGDDDAAVREAAILAVAKQGKSATKQLLPMLTPILDRGSPNARRGALLVIARLGDDVQLAEDVRKLVLRGARDPEATVRRAAVRALATTPPRPDTAPLLLSLVASNDEELREHAAQAISAHALKGGRTYVTPILKAIQSRDSATARGALQAVAYMGADAPKELIEPVTKRLHDDQTPIRRRAAATLGAIGWASPNDVIAALAKRYVAEPTVEVRVEIAVAFGRIGEDGPTLVMDPLLLCLKDPSRLVRAAAATSLQCAAGYRPEMTPATLALAGLLQDESADVRRSAATALGEFPEVAANVLQALDRAGKDTDSRVRLLATEAASKIRSASKKRN